MNFWEQEQENSSFGGKVSRNAKSGRTFWYHFLLFLVFVYYFALGITGLFDWYRFQRSMGECFILLFLTQFMTRKSLLHPFWRIGYIPFFSWILIFPYVLLHAVNGLKDASFNHLSPYFLTAIAILLLISSS